MNFVPKHVDYRSVSESKQYNNERKDIFSDVAGLKNESSRLKSQINTLTDLKEASDFTMLSKIQALETMLTDLNFGFTVVTLYNSDVVMYPESINVNAKARHEQLYGRAILNVIESQRLYIMKDIRTGKDTLVPNTEDMIFYYTNAEKTGSSINKIVETEIISAFDPTTNDVFLRRYETYEEMADVDLVVQMNTKNSLDAEYNNVYISPLPENNLTLDYIRYSSNSATNESFYNTSIQRYVDYAIPNFRRTAFAFNPVKLNRLEFRLKQANRISEAPYKFLLGLRDVSLVNHTYSNISYIGFKIRTDATRPHLIGLTTNLEDYPTNCQVFLYKTLNDFDEVTTDYVFRTGDDLDAVNYIDVSDSEFVYALVKLTPFAGVNNSPELTNIYFEWR